MNIAEVQENTEQENVEALVIKSGINLEQTLNNLENDTYFKSLTLSKNTLPRFTRSIPPCFNTAILKFFSRNISLKNITFEEHTLNVNFLRHILKAILSNPFCSLTKIGFNGRFSYASNCTAHLDGVNVTSEGEAKEQICKSVNEINEILEDLNESRKPYFKLSAHYLSKGNKTKEIPALPDDVLSRVSTMLFHRPMYRHTLSYNDVGADIVTEPLTIDCKPNDTWEGPRILNN